MDETNSENNASESPQTVSVFVFSGCLSSIVIAVSLFPLGLFLFSLLGRWIFAAELLSNFRLQLMFLLMPFPILLWVLRQWKWSMVLLAALAWSMVGVALIYLPGNQPPAGPKTVKVMSYNMLAGNPKTKEVLEYINQQDPDVVVAIEYASLWPKALKALDSNYPYQVLEPRWHGFGVALFSKFPIVSSNVYQLTKAKTDNPTIFATLDIEGQQIRIATVHTLSPTNVFRWELRNQQLSELAKRLDESRIPTAVVGDFNGTPWSPFFNDFLKETGYRDSRKGFGYQGTWPNRFSMINKSHPLIRVPIDQVFVSPGVHVHRRKTGAAHGSDHLPILVEMSVSPVADQLERHE